MKKIINKLRNVNAKNLCKKTIIKSIVLVMFLFITLNNVLAQGKYVAYYDTESAPCDDQSAVWYLGGNKVYPASYPPPPFVQNPMAPTPDEVQQILAYLQAIANISGYDIGTCNNVPFILKSNNVRSVFLTPSGNVGVGINNATPSAALDISSSNAHFKIYGDQNGTAESTGDMNLLATGGNMNLTGGGNMNLLAASGDMNLYHNGQFIVSLGNASSSSRIFAAGYGVVDINSGIDFRVMDGANNDYAFKVQGSTGKTSIGYQPNAPNSSMFNINTGSWSGGENVFEVYAEATQKINFSIKSDGNVKCRDLRVTTGPIPDFVFEKNYRLMTLNERDAYIKKEKHLPYMMSAKEVEAEGGAAVGKMMTGLLQNTEEMTLYMIEMNKKLEALADENKTLKAEIENLKAQNK